MCFFFSMQITCTTSQKKNGYTVFFLFIVCGKDVGYSFCLSSPPYFCIRLVFFCVLIFTLFLCLFPALSLHAMFFNRKTFSPSIHVQQQDTADREIFTVKIFSRLPQNAKIFSPKFIQPQTMITANSSYDELL